MFHKQPPSTCSAEEEMVRVLHTEPFRRATSKNYLHGRFDHWRHGPLHDVVQPMKEHVLMTYFGPMQRLERRTGRTVEAATARAGTITIIPAGSSSRWDIAGNVDVLHLYLPVALLEQLADQVNLNGPGDMRQRTGYPDPNAARLLAMTAKTLDGSAPIDSLFRQQLTFVLATHLLKNHVGRPLKPVEASGVLAPKVLRQALERLDSSCDNDVSLEALASEAGLSIFHFCRAFKKSTGMPPHAWLRERRLERAKIMLRKSDVAIGHIAEELGYGSQTAFSAAFKRMTGATPSRWRREQ